MFGFYISCCECKKETKVRHDTFTFRTDEIFYSIPNAAIPYGWIAPQGAHKTLFCGADCAKNWYEKNKSELNLKVLSPFVKGL